MVPPSKQDLYTRVAERPNSFAEDRRLIVRQLAAALQRRSVLIAALRASERRADCVAMSHSEMVEKVLELESRLEVPSNVPSNVLSNAPSDVPVQQLVDVLLAERESRDRRSAVLTLGSRLAYAYHRARFIQIVGGQVGRRCADPHHARLRHEGLQLGCAAGHADGAVGAGGSDGG